MPRIDLLALFQVSERVSSLPLAPTHHPARGQIKLLITPCSYITRIVNVPRQTLWLMNHNQPSSALFDLFTTPRTYEKTRTGALLDRFHEDRTFL